MASYGSFDLNLREDENDIGDPDLELAAATQQQQYLDHMRRTRNKALCVVGVGAAACAAGVGVVAAVSTNVVVVAVGQAATCGGTLALLLGIVAFCRTYFWYQPIQQQLNLA